MAWSRFLAVLCVVILPGRYCRQWSSSIPDGAVKYSCTGGFVIFPWAVSLSPGEEISDIQWFFQGPSGGKQMIGVFANGNLFTQPPFSQRVTFVPNAGISISHVTPSDTGNYSVEVKGRNSNGEYFSLSQDNYLRVLDGLQTTDGSLHVQQESSLVHDNVTGEWSVALTCGTFDYGSNQPSVSDVQWTTPEGNTVQSSYYQDGNFHLLLSQPVTGGTYTCQPSSDQAACLHGNSSHALRASVVVDDVKARLAVLETKLQNSRCNGTKTPGDQNTSLSHENANLRDQNALMENQLAVLAEENSRLAHQHEEQLRANALLSRQAQRLEHEFTQFKNAHPAAAHTHDAAGTQGQTCCSGPLRQTVQSLESGIENNHLQLIQQLQEHDTRLNNVTQQCSHLSQRVSSVESTSSHPTTSGSQSNDSFGRYSFQVRMSRGCSNCYACNVNAGNQILFSRVTHNTDYVYDHRTSSFRAPVNGTYFFLASAETAESSDHAGMYLMHGQREADFVYLYHSQHQAAGSVQAVIHLVQGESVWVRSISDHDGRFRCDATDFGGFLISQD